MITFISSKSYFGVENDKNSMANDNFLFLGLELWESGTILDIRWDSNWNEIDTEPSDDR
jgi:hypothetical protein